MMLPLLNHLWQSTLCLALIALLTLFLRRNGAHTRYWLWLAASAKFLLPFAVLATLGHYLAPAPAPSTRGPAILLPAAGLAQDITVPFTGATPRQTTPTVHWDGLVSMIWALGVFALLLHWTMRWWRLRTLIRESELVPTALPLPVRSSSTTLEPGLVGIFRPVLLLPRRLTEELTGAEIQSILAHELCHLRRRDNLTYAAHLLTQLVFWFYPPVWWLGARLIQERERACDEAVLAAGHAPQVYAESILKVCRFYVGAPVVGAAAVSGSDLTKRVRRIMSGWSGAPLGRAQKLLVGTSGVIIVALPVWFGVLASQNAAAQDNAGYSPPPGVTRQLFLQTRPQKEVTFDPGSFDRYEGYYAFGPMYLAHVFRRKDRFYIELTDERAEIFPESPTKFFATVRALQVGFVTDASTRVSGLVLYQDGFSRPAERVTESVAATAQAKLEARIKEGTASPGSEVALRKLIDGWERGQPDYEDMAPVLAYANHLNLAKVRALMQQLGPFKSMAFDRVAPNGWDVYTVTFAHGRRNVNITPLAFSSDGKVAGAYFSALP